MKCLSRDGTRDTVKLLDDAPGIKLEGSGKGEIIPLVVTVDLPPEDDPEKQVVIVVNEEEDGDGEDIIKSSLKSSDKKSSNEKRPVRFNSEISGVKNQVVEHNTKTLIPSEIHSKPVITQTSTLKNEKPEDVIKRTLSEWITEKTVQLLQGSDSDLESDEELEELLEKTEKLGIETEKFEVNPELLLETAVFRSKYNAFLLGKEVYEENIEIKEKEVEDDQNEPRLPLLDQHSQTQLRIKIVLDQLDRYLPGVLDLFSVPSRVIQEPLRELVRTFSLSATNITFKPEEWRLLSVMLIHMTSTLKEELTDRIRSKDGVQTMTVLLQHFLLDPSFPETTLSNVIQNLDKKKTDNK